ncbi:DJ-1/PfpI family protein [Actinocorallia populi]|uniref:DJ-1/PfpI family protein n=1 Tax=Actinocorallia populi TaxID=2079200 RepID=UPI000D0907C3|nr:DJ-1/PfpI family protein [Actinocorallia populi]
MRIVFPLYPNFTALDAIGPYEVLSRLPGAEAVFAAVEPGPVTTDTGALTVLAETALADITECDVVVVPGGPGCVAAGNDAAYTGWLAAVHPKTRWTASVCSGSMLLGAAGILQGLPATSHWAVTELLPVYGAAPTARRTVFTGKVVTAAGVASGIDMALALAAELTDRETAESIQLFIEYDPQPPFDTGSPAKAPAPMVERVRQQILSEV